MNLDDLIARASGEKKLTIDNDILIAAQAALNAETRAAAIKSVQGLLSVFEQALAGNVQRLRELRRLEKEQADLVARLDRALKYFGSSGNPLPVFRAMQTTGIANIGRRQEAYLIHEFCTAIKINIPANDDAAWKVPDDFQPEKK